MMLFKRVFLIVMDSVGCGALPDAALFGDVGTNTIQNIAKATNGIHLPILGSFGYGNLTTILGVPPVDNPQAYALKLGELSNGKDTMTGHWEIMGIHTTSPFQTFTDTGFPKELLDELERRTNRKIIGNIAASGTEIIDRLGKEHMETKAMIVYTSADSVLQIAAHEEIIPLDELYRICEIARDITMKPEWMVGRIIARPFLGNPNDGFKRTTNRHDYALSPTEPTVLDFLKKAHYDVISVGKINDIFNGSGITDHHKITSNHHGMEITTRLADTDFTGLCFVNLVDFDALYGHRRDPVGYKMALEEFDQDVKTFLNHLKPDDLLMITADHGNDPTHFGSDHTREYVPLFLYNQHFQGGILPDGETFADIAATIAEVFRVPQTAIGNSIVKHLK